VAVLVDEVRPFSALCGEHVEFDTVDVAADAVFEVDDLEM
jgi:hypothetical protein